MRTLVPIDDWRRWSVTALGVLLCGVIVGVVAVSQPEWDTLHLLQFGIPILLALGLAAYGGWLVQSSLASHRIRRIALWSLASAILLGTFATWEMYTHILEGEPFVETLHELLLGVTEGAIVGGTIGYYDVQRLEQLQETKRAQRAISASIDGIAILDEDGRYTEVNQAHADVYGYEGPEDFLGESWRMCYTDDKVAEFENQIMPVLEREGQWRGEATGKRRDGSSFPQEVTLTALEEGGLVCVVRDISDRRERERELERKTALLEKTQRMATVGGWELDLHDDELRWTDEIHRIHELPLDYEPELESALDFFHPEDTHRIEDAIEHAIEDGESYDIELRLITANDNLRWVRALGEPRQENGETIMLRGAFQDITNRKRRVQALEEAEGRFRALTENADFGVVTIDETSTIQYANDALEEVLGYRPAELEGESITNLMPERFRDDHHGGIQRYLREGTRNRDWDWLELPGLHRDGHEVPLGISFGETQLEDGPIFTGILRDITEQTERENQIASLHEASRQLMYASTPDEVASVTVEIANQILDKPLSAMWLYDEETNRLMPTATADSSQDFLEAAGVTELSPIGEGEFGMDVFQDGEITIIEDYDTVENPTYPNIPFGTVFVIPIEDHGILGIGADSIEEITDTDRHQIDILALNARAALDRAQREQALTRRQEMIESLHTATRDMVELEDTEQVCETAVNAADQLLDLPITGIWLSDDTGRRLDPVARSKEGDRVIDELPVYTAAEESLSWQAFESGETQVYDDLRSEASLANTETPIESEIIIPLGEYGVMNVGSRTAHSFDETDVRAAELLGANTTTALERVEREQELRSTSNLLSTLVENIPAGILAEDSARQIRFTNHEFTGLFDIDAAPDDLVGGDCEAAADRIKDRFVEAERFIDSTNEAVADNASIRREEFELVDGRTFERSGTPVQLEEEEGMGYLWVYHDITDRKRAEDRFRTLFEHLPDPGVIVELTEEEAITQAVNAAFEDVFGYSAETAIDASLNNLIVPPEYEDESTEIDQQARSGDQLIKEVRRQTADGEMRDFLFRNVFIETVEGAPRAHGIYTDITERKQRERRLNALHDATRELMAADTRQEVAEIASRTASDILELPLNGVHLYDEDVNGMVPVAVSPKTHDVLGDPSTIQNGEGIAWQVFESGEPRVYDDVRTAPAAHDPETPIRSELHLPLGEHGVFLLASTTVADFDETDVSLAKVLAANVQAALDRARHEQELRDREQELEMQMDRMEFFNSILRHDVLNGMTVIRGHADFLTDELDGDQLRDAEAILHSSEDIVKIVQRVRTTLDTLTDGSDIQLEPVELSETLQEKLSHIRDTYPVVTFETELPDSVHVRANELLSEVLGNLVTNAVDHNETEGLCVSITALERTDDSMAVLRIADNGNGVPDEAKERIFRRDATGHAKSSGSGFGLFFVDSMVESYGGDIWVEDNDAGGATFVLELPLAEVLTPA